MEEEEEVVVVGGIDHLASERWGVVVVGRMNRSLKSGKGEKNKWCPSVPSSSALAGIGL